MQALRSVQAWAWGAGASVAIALGACLPGSGPALNIEGDDASTAPPVIFGDDGGTRLDVDLGDPFAVTGLQPSHGPWTGGTRVTVAGRGFSSKIQVWIGPTQLDPSAIFASDPTRAAVVTPPGAPGPADVRVRNVTSADGRTLTAGFFYESFVVQPDAGATTGGTRIALVGSGTRWTSSSTVSVGGNACTDVTVADATHLSCSTPPGAAGVQDVTVTNADGSLDQARDAFTYSDSPDGFRGGLYGSALSGNLKVLAFDSQAGTPLVGAKAIAGGDIATAIVATLDAAGVAQMSDPKLTGSITVTVAAKCHQPITFVDVPVDTVTAYLDPELDPSCAQGDPRSTGNFVTRDLGTVQGQLMWQSTGEFQRAPWFNVPKPAGPNEKQTAYVWTAAGNPLDSFGLPPASSATTPDSSGQLGYDYSLSALPGNDTIYGMAGLEDRSVNPPRFEPFVMGVVRGVPVQPNATTVGVDIPMTTLFDHQVTTVPQPPPGSPRGPDRLVSTVSLVLGPSLFAILPQGTKTTLLPLPGDVSFVGVPSLDGTLDSSAYRLTGSAVTGAGGGVPSSVVVDVQTTDANEPVTVGGFLSVPTFVEPSSATWSGTHVSVGASGPIDLIVLDVSSGQGLVNWRFVAPGGETAFDVPDLAQVPGVSGLVRGSIRATLSLARIGGLDYGQLRYGQMTTSAWNAYARDTVVGSY